MHMLPPRRPSVSNGPHLSHTQPYPEGPHQSPHPGRALLAPPTKYKSPDTNQMDPIDRWSTGFEQALKALGLSADDSPTLPFLRSLAAPYQSVQAFYSSMSGAGQSCSAVLYVIHPLRSIRREHASIQAVFTLHHVGKSSLFNALFGSVPAAEIVASSWFREGVGLLFTSEFTRGTDCPSYLSPM